MPNLNYNPDKDIPALSGKTIFITGGKRSSLDVHMNIILGLEF